MTISLHLHQVTVYLLITTGGLVVLGPLLAATVFRSFEIGALMPWAICWVLAAVALVLAVGSLL